MIKHVDEEYVHEFCASAFGKRIVSNIVQHLHVDSSIIEKAVAAVTKLAAFEATNAALITLAEAGAIPRLLALIEAKPEMFNPVHTLRLFVSPRIPTLCAQVAETGVSLIVNQFFMDIEDYPYDPADNAEIVCSLMTTRYPEVSKKYAVQDEILDAWVALTNTPLEGDFTIIELIGDRDREDEWSGIMLAEALRRHLDADDERKLASAKRFATAFPPARDAS